MSRAKPKLVPLRKGKVPDDHPLIESLVQILKEAREGKIAGYALTFITDGDGAYTSHMSMASEDKSHRFMMLGALRRLEHRFHAMSWDDDE